MSLVDEVIQGWTGEHSLAALQVASLSHDLFAEAQPVAKVYRIGFILTAESQTTVHLGKALDDGLGELGYVEGQNVVIERRFASGEQERLPALAAELVRQKLDVIVTGSNPVIAAVKQSTATIPVVMTVSRDPVGSGFIASLARPGGISPDWPTTQRQKFWARLWSY